MFFDQLLVTTFGDHEDQWVDGAPFCPFCERENLTGLIRIASDVAETWRRIADDLAAVVRSYPAPVPQDVTNALIIYDRTCQGRF